MQHTVVHFRGLPAGTSEITFAALASSTTSRVLHTHLSPTRTSGFATYSTWQGAYDALVSITESVSLNPNPLWRGFHGVIVNERERDRVLREGSPTDTETDINPSLDPRYPLYPSPLHTSPLHPSLYASAPMPSAQHPSAPMPSAQHPSAPMPSAQHPSAHAFGAAPYPFPPASQYDPSTRATPLSAARMALDLACAATASAASCAETAWSAVSAAEYALETARLSEEGAGRAGSGGGNGGGGSSRAAEAAQRGIEGAVAGASAAARAMRNAMREICVAAEALEEMASAGADPDGDMGRG